MEAFSFSLSAASAAFSFVRPSIRLSRSVLDFSISGPLVFNCSFSFRVLVSWQAAGGNARAAASTTVIAVYFRMRVLPQNAGLWCLRPLSSAGRVKDTIESSSHETKREQREPVETAAPFGIRASKWYNQ